jgi:4-amino-4-deoxy-L-arabinose transferase-like glycosyltransferase
MNSKQWQAELIALALFMLAKSLIWAFINPPFNTGDESAHLAYIMQVRNNNALPIFKYAPNCSSGENTTPPDPSTLALIQSSGYAQLAPFTAQPYESYQPPLYYLAAALVASPLPKNDAVGTLYAARALSALLVAVTVVIFAYAVRELTLRPGLSLAVALFVSSIPTFGFIGGMVNNDNMLNLFAAATLLACLRIIRTPQTMLIPGSLLLGLLAGGGLLSKASALALVPVALLAILLAAILLVHGEQTEQVGWRTVVSQLLHTKAFWRKAIWGVIAFGVCLFTVAGWNMVRNLTEYGDLTGTANQLLYGSRCLGPTIIEGGLGQLPRYLMSLALLTPFSFIANFGWGDENTGITLYYVIILPVLMASIYFALRWLRRHLAGLSIAQKMGLLVLVVLVLTNLVIWIGFNFTMQYQPTGRYLYMAILPIAGLWFLGLAAFPGGQRTRNLLVIAAIVALNVLTFQGWLFAGTGWMATHAAQLGY